MDVDCIAFILQVKIGVDCVHRSLASLDMEQTMQVPACRPRRSQIQDLGGNDFIAIVVKCALKGQQLGEFIIDASKEALKPHLQGFNLKALIMNGIQLSQVWDFLKCQKASLHGKTMGAMFYQDIVMLGVNETLSKGYLDRIMIDRMQEILTSGQLDDTLLASAAIVKQSLRYDDLLMDSITTILESRQLDNSLLYIFNEALQNGDLDDIIMSSATEVLDSGNWHTIEIIIDQLIFQVST